MIIYRVSVRVERVIAPQWLAWMRKTHMPDVMKTGCFDDSYMLKPLQDEGQHVVYVMEYVTTSLSRLEHYQRQFATALQEDHRLKFRERASATREVLEVVK